MGPLFCVRTLLAPCSSRLLHGSRSGMESDMASNPTSAAPTSRSNGVPVSGAKALDSLKGRYLETVQLMERLHRQFLELIQSELDDTKADDVNSVQALILHAIGREEVRVGDLTH